MIDLIICAELTAFFCDLASGTSGASVLGVAIGLAAGILPRGLGPTSDAENRGPGRYLGPS